MTSGKPVPVNQAAGQPLGDVWLFQGLSRQDLQPLERAAQAMNLPKGQILLSQGQVPSGLFVIQRGHLELYADGHSLGQVGPGECLGQTASLLGCPSPHGAVATTHCELSYLSRADFQSLVPKPVLLRLLEIHRQQAAGSELELKEFIRNSPQALLKLNRQGTITEEASSIAQRLLAPELEQRLEGMAFDQVMERLDPGFFSEWQVFHQFFKTKITDPAFETLASLLPKEASWTLKGEIRCFAFSYQPWRDHWGHIQGLYVGLEDQTSRKILAQREAQTRQLNHIYADPQSFFDLLKKAEGLLPLMISGACADSSEQMNFMQRELHHLKSTGGQFLLEDFQKACHYLELRLSSPHWEVSREKDGFLQALLEVASLTEELSPELSQRLHGLSLTPNQVQLLRQAILDGQTEGALQILTQASQRPLRLLLQQYAKECLKEGQPMGLLLEVSLQGGDIGLSAGLFDDLRVLVQLFRNALEHGLERPDERLAKGKPAKGRVLVEVYTQREQLHILFADDGRGLDPNLLLDKALRLGINLEGWQNPLDLIFVPGFSTKEEITPRSGLGMGLCILKEQITGKLKGNLQLANRPGLGLEFKLTLPLL